MVVVMVEILGSILLKIDEGFREFSIAPPPPPPFLVRLTLDVGGFSWILILQLHLLVIGEIVCWAWICCVFVQP